MKTLDENALKKLITLIKTKLSNYFPLSGGTITGDTTVTAGKSIQLDTLKMPTTSGGTTYGVGSSGQVLKSNGTTVYWGNDNNTTYSAATTSANGLMTKEDKAKLDNLQVGGRNLLANTDVIYTRTKNDTSVKNYSFYVVSDINLNNLIGEKVVYSYWLNSPGERTQHETSDDVMKNRFGSHGVIVWKDSTGVNPNTAAYPFVSYLTLTKEKTRIYQTYTITPPVGYDTIINMYVFFQLYARPADTNNATWEIGQPKLEIGTIPTDWTPAPEDLAEKDHTHTKSQITDFPTSLKNPKALTLRYNGNLATEVVYDGSGTNTFDVTPSYIGAAEKDHTHDAATTSSSGFLSSTDKEKLDGIAAGAQVNQKAFSQFTVGTTEIKADTATDILTLVAGSNVTLTPDATNDTITIAAKDTTYSTGTENTAGITKLYGGLGVNSDGTMTQEAIGIELAKKAGNMHTHTTSDITDFPTSLKNPNALTVKTDGTTLYTYDGSEAKTINIKAGANVTITSDNSGNIIINSSGSSSGDAGVIVYEAESGGLYCDGSTYKHLGVNACEIQDLNPDGYYKRFRFYCQGYYGLVCVDMPLDREHPAYGATNGTRYCGVIFPTAENGNINNTGIGPSSHMYYELKWKVTKDSGYWTVQVVDSGWLGLNAGIATNDDYTGNASTSNVGTGYVSWNQRHNSDYCIYKIVAYTI